MPPVWGSGQDSTAMSPQMWPQTRSRLVPVDRHPVKGLVKGMSPKLPRKLSQPVDDRSTLRRPRRLEAAE